jgi:hypothetical protein
MGTVVAALISAAGSIFSGFFGWKGDQAKTVQTALELLKEVNSSDGQAVTAAATALQAILTQGIWIEKVWRPLLMFILMGIIFSYWFLGYIPPYFNAPMTPMMQEIFGLLKIGLGGYIPCRTIEKIAQQINIGSILKTLIEKKIS